MFDKESLQLLQQADAIERANDALVRGVQSDHAACALPSDIQVTDLECYLPNRRRARGVMKTSDVKSYIAYVTGAVDTAKTGKSGTQLARAFVNDDAMCAVTVLDFGDATIPLHCDDTAELQMEKTADYKALLAIADQPKSQRDIAEFLEDWVPNIECANDADALIDAGKAASAVRRLTIDAARKQEHVDESLSASKSTFESVTASSSLGLPKIVRFRCVPYLGLAERVFYMRVSLRLGDDKPQFILRSIKLDAVRQEMAEEFGELMEADLAGAGIPVVHGVYAAAK